ncbi:Hypothetical protein R9X50_00198900 [Acrodontium crateriforme]|uniref:peptidylprolyl isomerase n=1 Tax=Acrodontium crateriforme TaxID=150365 RepID=A0AAQ3M043_9PEZI|nr:Hypothetical protein R9X50_00198900 [Acrodontium crateriforme]
MAPTSRPRVFLDINIGDRPAGRITIELFTDRTPKTCENFRALCSGDINGLTYAKSPFHRVIDEFMVQGGDIAHGDGTGTTSIYGGEFEDENLLWREMDAAFLVCSANRGRDTNGSQFFITLDECPHLNGKHTIFGRLVSGQETLKTIAKVEVDKDDRPLEPVLVARCGELERKRKRSSPALHSRPAPESADRGRRRKSDVSDEEMEDIPEPTQPRRTRRQSDNVIDEGLRGRPRQRSHKRSDSRPLSTTDEDDGQYRDSSAQSKHKRKRSPSPSRPPDLNQEPGDHEHRRRRSLPNQYLADKHRARNGDEERYKPSPRRNDNWGPGRRHGDELQSRRDHDHYHPSRGRRRDENEGRLESSSDGRLRRYDDGHELPVKFKGRGIMKYREPGRL